MRNQHELELIERWYQNYAPGLERQPIPEGAFIKVIEPIVPYGLQYRVELLNGTSYPRHQSGPGATVVGVVEKKAILIKEEFREETGKCIIKCAGGFAGHNQDVAREIVQIFNRLPGYIKVSPGIWPYLIGFIKKLFLREYEIEIEQNPVFFGKPLGWPNIKICSIMGMVEIDLKGKKFSSGSNIRLINFLEARTLYDEGEFGDVNTAEAVLEVIKRFK